MTDIDPRQSPPRAPHGSAAQDAGQNAEAARNQDAGRHPDGQPRPGPDQRRGHAQDPVISERNAENREADREDTGNVSWSNYESTDPISLQDWSDEQEGEDEEEDEDDSQSPMDL